MAGRRNDSSVVDLFDSIELDCSKWTDEELAAFWAAVGVPPCAAVGSIVATMMAAARFDGTGPANVVDLQINENVLRGLCWITRRRCQPGLQFVDVEVKDRAAVASAIERQITGIITRVLHHCGPETLALCLSVMLASVCGREPVD